jgi:DNA-binding NarL/FixJ family response regulator
MKKINITFVSPREAALEECADLMVENPDIDLIAMPSGLTQQGAWLALSGSDVVIIEEEVIRLEGFETVRMLLECYPEVKCLVIMERDHKPRMIWAVMQGIHGVMARSNGAWLLGKAIRRLHAGEIWLSRGLFKPIRNELLAQQRQPGNHFVAVNDWVRRH